MKSLACKKRIVSEILGVGVNRVWFDSTKLNNVKEAITREDLRGLVREGVIRVKPVKGHSRVRARKILEQKRKGRRQGSGSRKGKASSRLPRKKAWELKIRTQRKLFNLLKEKDLITQKTYRLLRDKAKGGLFRSKRHIKLFLEDNNLIVKEKKK